MRKGLMSVIAFALLVMATPVAYAQQLAASPPQVAATTNPYVGTWHGVIGTYPFKDSPQRTLVVTETGGRLACRWGLSGQSQIPSSCSVEGGVLGLTTDSGSLVVLSALGGRLEGSFTPPRSRDLLPLSMGQTPLPAYQPAALQNTPQAPGKSGALDGKTCTGEFSIVGNSYYGGGNPVTFTFKDGKVVARVSTYGGYDPAPYTPRAGGGYQFKVWSLWGNWSWEMIPKSNYEYDLKGMNLAKGNVPAYGKIRC